MERLGASCCSASPAPSRWTSSARSRCSQSPSASPPGATPPRSWLPADGRFTTNSGLAVTPDGSIVACRGADRHPGRGRRARRARGRARRARSCAGSARAAQRSRRVTSVCTGAFLLAEAGLLEGRRVTTHWASAERLAERHPAIEVDPDSIFVRDGDVWTSAGVTAGMDLALALVEDDLGARGGAGGGALAGGVRPAAPAASPSSAPRWRPRPPSASRCARCRSGCGPTPPATAPWRRWPARACMSPRNFSRAFAPRWA